MSLNYPTLALEARRKVLQLIHRAQTSHIASNLSVIDIATVLYDNIGEHDLVVWSKGWAAASVYYFLYLEGKITEEQLNSFPNPPFLGLAETTVPGVLVNGGSVGHGLSVAVGMALGKKRAGERGHIYCLMSDGEMNEGAIWEAAMLASHHELDNLTAIVDKNGWQAMGKTEEVVNMESLSRKWRAFNFDVFEVDGHDFTELETTLSFKTSGPKMILAQTVKGKGISFMENHLTYHYKNISDEDYERALKELC